MAIRKIIKLFDFQHNSLRDLIESEAIPDGQFIRRWSWFTDIVETFNDLNDCSYSPEEVHHYIMTLRKRPQTRLPRWEALGDGCAQMPGATYSALTPEEQLHLVQAYVELAKRLGAGSDSILVNGANRRELARIFAALSGRGINDRSLIAAVIDLRKDDRLPRLGGATKKKQPRKRFGGFDDAEAM